MNLYDLFTIGALTIFAILGLMQGLVRQVLTLGGAIAGALLAFNYYPLVAQKVPLDDQATRNIVAYVLILVATIFVGCSMSISCLPSGSVTSNVNSSPGLLNSYVFSL